MGGLLSQPVTTKARTRPHVVPSFWRPAVNPHIATPQPVRRPQSLACILVEDVLTARRPVLATLQESSSDENTCFLYGASAMQGWRPEMVSEPPMHLRQLGRRHARVSSWLSGGEREGFSWD